MQALFVRQSGCGANAAGGHGFQPGNTCASDNKTSSTGVAGGLAEKIRKSGGFTHHVLSGEATKTGYALSILPQHEKSFDSVDDVTPEALAEYIVEAAKLAETNPGLHVGAWWNSKEFGNSSGDERVYLDMSIVVDSMEEARSLARSHGQLGMYDLSKGETIQTMTADERSQWERENAKVTKSAAVGRYGPAKEDQSRRPGSDSGSVPGYNRRSMFGSAIAGAGRQAGQNVPAVDRRGIVTKAGNPMSDDPEIESFFSKASSAVSIPLYAEKSQTSEREWMWAAIPEPLASRIREWQQVLKEAVPEAELEDDLHITLFHRLTDFPNDLRHIINQCANTVPCEASIGSLISWRVAQDGIAIVLAVECRQLKELRAELQGAISHETSMHNFTPHITLAYVPRVDVQDLNGLELVGIAWKEFTIHRLFAGTKRSHHECVLLGADPAWMRRAGDITVKAAGMTTTTGEQGGFLSRRKNPIEDEMDDDLEDDNDDDMELSEDQDDEQETQRWLNRSFQIADHLDEMFGAF